MVAIFALCACVYLDAPAWIFLIGFLCLLLSDGKKGCDCE